MSDGDLEGSCVMLWPSCAESSMSSLSSIGRKDVFDLLARLLLIFGQGMNLSDTWGSDATSADTSASARWYSFRRWAASGVISLDFAAS